MQLEIYEFEKNESSSHEEMERQARQCVEEELRVGVWGRVMKQLVLPRLAVCMCVCGKAAAVMIAKDMYCKHGPTTYTHAHACTHASQRPNCGCTIFVMPWPGRCGV